MDDVVALLHQRRELMHELKGIQALLQNNITLDKRGGWTPERAAEQHRHVISLAANRLAQITGGVE